MKPHGAPPLSGVPGGRSAFSPPGSEGARSLCPPGEKLEKPVAGCVAVFSRMVADTLEFVVGAYKAGNLLVLGGNQADAVNVKAFPVHG